jgi:hypothetical protein
MMANETGTCSAVMSVDYWVEMLADKKASRSADSKVARKGST